MSSSGAPSLPGHIARPRSGLAAKLVRRGWTARWVFGFVMFQIACQLLLLSSSFSAGRVILRSAAFGASLLLLIVVPLRHRRHPSVAGAQWVLGIVLLSMAHPSGNTLIAVLAQVAMYFAILAPLFWVPRLKFGAEDFQRVVAILWIFHTVSAVFGILQVMYPGQFQPAISSVYTTAAEGYLGSLQITTASGQQVFRPMGLTDVPGGAATSGLYAALFSTGFLLVARRSLVRTFCVLSMGVGTACLYLAQVRATLITTAISLIVFCGVLALRGRLGKLGFIGVVIGAVATLALAGATSVGGEAVSRRIGTLTEGAPLEVYYENRGRFLEHTVTELLPNYPLGAGLGRWGMMNSYFGDNTNPQSEAIWAEIQWTGWLLDGGVPLILAYVLALLIAARFAWWVAGRGTQNLWVWGSLLLAYNVGAFALTFSYPIFISQSGLELWLLNAALFAAWRDSRRPEAAGTGRPVR